MSKAKTLQPEAQGSSKRKGYRFWIGCLIVLLGLPLLYYGYCWGWWGKQSLLLQYLFQCSCPVAGLEERYPDEVDVIVPACRYESTRLLPGGRFLYVLEKRFWITSMYLLDLQTNEKLSINLPDSPFYFLTDNLVYVTSSDEYILDWTNKKQYPIRKFVYSQAGPYAAGDVNLKLLAEALHKAKHVFLINDNDTVVALSSDFPASPELNFLTGWFDIPGFDPNRVAQFLRENNIVYQSIAENFPEEAVSRDGRFVARNDGIYLIETGQKVVDAYPSRVKGWVIDGRGVIYSSSGPCLIQTNFGFLDDSTCFFQISQPVLKLKVPAEYLTSTQIP